MNRLCILRSVVFYIRGTARTITVIMIWFVINSEAVVCVSIRVFIIWFFSSSSFCKKLRLSFRMLKLLSWSLKLFNEVTKEFDMDSILLFISQFRTSPVDTGRKLNVHKTFRRRPGRLLKVLCTFNLRPVSTGSLSRLKTSSRFILVKAKYHLETLYLHVF